jgi:hypothetical protein
VFGIPGHDAVRQGKECSEEGQWIEKNGERVRIPDEDIVYRPFHSRDARKGHDTTTEYETNSKHGIKGYIEAESNGTYRYSVVNNGKNAYETGGFLIAVGSTESLREAKRSVNDTLRKYWGKPNEHSSHLYRNGAKYREQKKFEKEYGKKKGDYIYGAIVGKVRRERLAKGRK